MDLIVYHEKYEFPEFLEDYINFFNSSKMSYLASDLLDEGFSPTALNKAIQRAISACKSSGLEVNKHFLPLYTQINHMTIRDCKMTRLGYGLLLLNADPENPIVGKWQLKLVSRMFNIHAN